ncbi:unnamed protein product [Callosobruchus maculatus]|uniref:Methyltransferase-like protein n=1 Tax=Callosobruchus maculatus TaxID=64391 RepID=A0A653D406_CALMS|nr:unnamed protein product [Callosobruchus maculatus]
MAAPALQLVEMCEENEEFTDTAIQLTDDNLSQLLLQNTRKVSEFKAALLEKDAKKNWDLFYKRNETRFFKDRHWTMREFQELLNHHVDGQTSQRTLFEIGCGVGNFIFPLIEEKLNFHVVACDLSPLYSSNCIHVFQCDITTEDVFDEVKPNSIDIGTLIFVLSAIHPDKFVSTLKRIFTLLKPGGLLLFRDYGLYDMAQLRFKAGHKIDENFYMRQDGTRVYYFSVDYLKQLLIEAGFEILVNCYVHRRTVNKKENIDIQSLLNGFPQDWKSSSISLYIEDTFMNFPR